MFALLATGELPARMFLSGANADTGTVAGGPLGAFTLLLGEKTEMGSFADPPEANKFKAECDSLAREAVGSLAKK